MVITKQTFNLFTTPCKYWKNKYYLIQKIINSFIQNSISLIFTLPKKGKKKGWLISNF